MASKSDFAEPSPLARLDDLAIVALRGPEAEIFAQSQFMNDVAALDPGQWHWNGWLCAKGRVQAFFALLRKAPGDLALVLFDADPGEFCAGLRRFVFRTKVVVTHETAWAAFAEYPDGPVPAGPGDRLIQGQEGEWALDCSGATLARRLWVRPASGEPDQDASARWRAIDLQHGLPRWPRGTPPTWTPHMLSLDRLRAFSVGKGCYPGQEIVARTHFLGRAKRQSWWITGHGLKPGTRLDDADGRAIGELVESTADGRHGLAVAAPTTNAVMYTGGQAVTAAAPTTGLARPR